MRKLCLLTSLLLLLPLLPAADILGYDITFSKTINDSLMVIDSEKFGIDYTGYGYIGSSTMGLYMRAGLQAPFSSLEMLFENSRELPASWATDDTEKIKNMLETFFRFSAAAGPAFRSILSDKLVWYMGLGLSGRLDYANRNGNLIAAVSYFDIDIGTSFDIGFRFDIEEKTTIKIGMSIEAPIFSINFMTYASGDGGRELLAKPSMIPYLFLPEEMHRNTKALGYISLGHTFRQDRVDTVYRYTITSDETGKGKLEIIPRSRRSHR